jgi:hypothetical protein
LKSQAVSAKIMNRLPIHSGFKKLGFKVFEKALRRGGKMVNHKRYKIGRGNLGEFEKGKTPDHLFFKFFKNGTS